MEKMPIAVLASGRGSNFLAIIEAIKRGECAANIEVFITDNPQAKAIDIAKANRIPAEIIDRKKIPDRVKFDLEIKKALDKYEVQLVVLAGYMRIIVSRELLDAYKYRIINIHPSLLPAFKGSTHAQHEAFDYGCRVSGLTIHFVTDDVDGGPVIYQEAVDLGSCKTGDEVAELIIRHEHKAYPKIVDSFAKGKYEMRGKRVVYIPRKP
ncbi:phosphoribosylglycinamide formyltransferase [Candidatus Micrarchaeota archaeon]|nr:phosphoribosylglycinamide formyltransferase [Candidatus Micrarchaeota archaeon]